MSKVIILLALVALLSITDARSRRRHQRQRHHDDDCKKEVDGTKLFYSISYDAIKADRKVQGFCRQNKPSSKIVESYDETAYRITIPAQNVTKTFKMKVKHTAMYVYGEVDGKEIDIIKILPEVINPRSAAWKFVDGLLKISFSYEKDKAAEEELACRGDIDSQTYKYVLEGENTAESSEVITEDPNENVLPGAVDPEKLN